MSLLIAGRRCVHGQRGSTGGGLAGSVCSQPGSLTGLMNTPGWESRYRYTDVVPASGCAVVG